MQAARAQAIETLVVGTGATGLSVLRHLARTGEPALLADTRADPPGLAGVLAEFADVALYCGQIPAALWRRVARVVVSPGVGPDHALLEPARAAGVEVVGDIELFARVAPAPVIAITGTNGKSTVTTLTAHLLRAAGCRALAGGNLGPPALDLLVEPVPDFYVLEVSSFQLETTASLRARAAAVLNLTPDHLDRHADFRAYAATKARVLHGAGTAVLNADDPAVAALAALCPAPPCWFGAGPQAADGFGLLDHAGESWFARAGQPLAPRSAFPMPGAHNAANALAALALVEAAGVDAAVAADGLGSYQPLAHRTQFVARAAGLDWYDDSKGTNVGATCAALDGLGHDYPGRVVLIAGGVGKGQDFSALREPVARAASAVVLIGTDAPRIEAALGGCVPVAHAPDMARAVRTAAALAEPGGAVLLSPACASFDQFSDYRARGQAFRAAVAALGDTDG